MNPTDLPDLSKPKFVISNRGKTKFRGQIFRINPKNPNDYQILSVPNRLAPACPLGSISLREHSKALRAYSHVAARAAGTVNVFRAGGDQG